MLLLAGSWMLVIGLLNLFYAISVIAGSTIFITKAAWLVVMGAANLAVARARTPLSSTRERAC